MCEPKSGGWVGGDPLLPPPWKVRGRASSFPLSPPLFLRLCLPNKDAHQVFQLLQSLASFDFLFGCLTALLREEQTGQTGNIDDPIKKTKRTLELLLAGSGEKP